MRTQYQMAQTWYFICIKRIISSLYYVLIILWWICLWKLTKCHTFPLHGCHPIWTSDTPCLVSLVHRDRTLSIAAKVTELTIPMSRKEKGKKSMSPPSAVATWWGSTGGYDGRRHTIYVATPHKSSKLQNWSVVLDRLIAFIMKLLLMRGYYMNMHPCGLSGLIHFVSIMVNTPVSCILARWWLNMSRNSVLTRNTLLGQQGSKLGAKIEHFLPAKIAVLQLVSRAMVTFFLPI